MNKKKTEYSKKLLIWTITIFCINLFFALLFSWYGKDTSIFMYSIPTTGGILGAAVTFYYNKAKIENVCKGKIAFLKYKMKLLEKHPKCKEEIENELSTIDSAMTNKIDSEMESAVSEDITIQNY